ncbi:hypothetical protein EMIHUDRAFT_442928, partial [Emiliania huxleyi CCMP1516]|uniref:SCA7 domain-containing protein n=2 Tax=Emiliania huxleyi TaxID=2903 RepID=A0A0D3JYX3_EMIH1
MAGNRTTMLGRGAHAVSSAAGGEIRRDLRGGAVPRRAPTANGAVVRPLQPRAAAAGAAQAGRTPEQAAAELASHSAGRVSGQPARLEEQRPGADRFRLPPPLDARDVAYCIMLPPFGACHGSLCSRHALDTRTPCSRPRRIPHPRPPPHPRDHARLPEISRGYPRVPESRPPPGPRPPSWGALCATAHRRHI